MAFIFILVLNFLIFGSFGDELKGVVVIYRHGDRTPVDPYPNDPYRNSSYWPVGFGQLINKGKLRHLELGRWLRNRYKNYLPEIYNANDIHIQSTDVDRTLMSAEANLAGLYPPMASQKFDKNLTWQPIPIHTIPEKMDALLAGKKECAKYTELRNALFKTPYFRNISRKYHDLFAYLTVKSGNKVTTLEKLEYLYNTLLIETFFNYTLPTWAQSAFKKMEPLAFLSFATQTYTPELARLKSGPLFDQIINYFQSRIDQSESKKMMVYSAHDTTIANLLNSMGLFEYHSPPYASTVIFELRGNNSTNYLNIFYKNSTEPQNMTLKTCSFNCNFKMFVQIMSPVALPLSQWEQACSNDGTNWYLQPFYIYIFGMVIFVLFAAIVLKMLLNLVNKKTDSSYIQLPNEEEA
ncbi:unnamed protein product [Brassicogethes aeneus]|uniref:acid phosphatase n=1 Tax=Brassicogethes aeneus TaxID=1431903 RepID=A0A9P0AW59_BRAAE|nr:unnamed protein product [Brassicogethes aeneus]